MIVQVKLFAAARQAVGNDCVAVELDDQATVAELRAQLVRQFPELATWEPHLLFAVEQQFATDQQPLAHDVEVACFPPVSGG